MEFLLFCVQVDISLIRCSRSWDIKLNTRGEFHIYRFVGPYFPPRYRRVFVQFLQLWRQNRLYQYHWVLLMQMQGWALRKWENLQWWVIVIIYISKIMYLKFPISLRESRWLFLRMDFELLQIRSFFSFTRIILPEILIESANLIHRNSIILFLRYKLEKYIPHE